MIDPARLFKSARPGEAFSARGLGLLTLLCLGISYGLAWHRWSDLATLVGLLMLLCLLGFIWKLIARGIGAAKRAVDIRGETPPLVPLAPATEAFDLTQIPAVQMESPAVKGEWKSILNDQEILTQYAVRLDEVRRGTDRIADAAIQKFNGDRLKLLEQQRNVMRRAFAAKAKIGRFKELPRIKISTANLPQFSRLALPEIPNYLTPEAYAKKYRINASPAVSTVTRSFVTSGFNQTNVIAAAATLAVGVVMAKQLISKSLRALEDARGQVLNANNAARNTVTLLGRSHEEIVAASHRLRDIASEIDGLVRNAGAIQRDKRLLAELTSQQQQELKTLWYWIICADQMAKNSVV